MPDPTQQFNLNDKVYKGIKVKVNFGQHQDSEIQASSNDNDTNA